LRQVDCGGCGCKPGPSRQGTGRKKSHMWQVGQEIKWVHAAASAVAAEHAVEENKRGKEASESSSGAQPAVGISGSCAWYCACRHAGANAGRQASRRQARTKWIGWPYELQGSEQGIGPQAHQANKSRGMALPRALPRALMRLANAQCTSAHGRAARDS